MTLALALASLGLLLLAGAVELWWGVPARRRQRASLSHAEGRLQAASGPASAATVGSTPRGAAISAPAAALPWDGLLRRASLPVGWRVPLALLLPGLLLSLFAASRLGTVWMAPLTFVVYTLAVWFWLQRRVVQLQRKLLRQLPDFLDNVVRLAGIGNSLPMAFQSAATQIPMPLRGLLDSTVLHTRNGLDLDRALSLAAQPYRLEVLEVLAVVLGVSVRIGGRADQILQRMSDFMRDLEQAQQELLATTSETRMSAWVLGLLPPICATLMAIASPDFFQPVIEQPLGHKLLALALALEAIGAFLLYRLAKSI